MAMNRIQFQPGLSLTQFLEQYGTEERCEQALEQARWPEGYCCEHCASTHYCIVNADGRKTYQCHRCHHQTHAESRHDLSCLQVAAGALVSGHVPDEPVEKQHLGP